MPSTVKIQVSFIIVNYYAREQEKVLKDSRKKKKRIGLAVIPTKQ